MKSTVSIRGGMALTAILATAISAIAQAPQGTAFTYQGMLKRNGAPVDGDNQADVQAKLFDALSGGGQIGSTLTISNVDFENGLFTIVLDFSATPFTGQARWLELAVRVPPGSGTWTTLSPRQPVNASPYALYALSAPSSGGPWQLSGSDIYYSAGNVGIGRAPTSGYELDVKALGSNSANFRLESGQGTRLDFAAMDLSYGYIGTASSVPLLLSTNSTERMRIETDGSVGIGNPSPGYPLHFGSTTGEKICFYGPAGGANTGIGLSTTTLLIHGPTSSGAAAFGYGSAAAFTESARITWDGKLGLGTPSPADRLTIQNGALRFSNTADAKNWVLAYDSASNYFYIDEYGEARRLVIENGGDVGIGTYNPAARLDVAGTTRTTGFQLTTTPSAGYVLTSDASGVGSWQPPGAFTLPFSASIASASPAMSITNGGTGGAVRGIVSNFTDNHDIAAVAGIINGSYGTNTGVYGEASASLGGTANYGVHGEATGSVMGGDAYGVYGESSAANADASSYGVYGKSMSEDGVGVYGEATANVGEGIGVFGITGAVDGYAVRGFTAAQGATGILGEATNIQGDGIGVRGYTNGPTGYGGVFSGPDNNGTVAALKVYNGTATLLMDGNEIDSNGALYFQNNSQQNILLAPNAGRVGIGTTTPAQKLAVVGEASITGGLGVTGQVSAGGGFVFPNGGLVTEAPSWWKESLSDPYAIYLNVAYDRVGIGNQTPDCTLDVVAAEAPAGPYEEHGTITAKCLDLDDHSAAILGIHQEENVGVGVLGRGGNKGVYGISAPENATVEWAEHYGVYGHALGFTTYGVYGYAGPAAGGNSYGVWGEAQGSVDGATYGVYAASHESGGTRPGYGLYAVSDGTGLYHYAGYFAGKVHVNGTLSKSAGSFKIDHPLDPEHKYLSHSFVESPDMMNIYNGNVTTDEKGEARVEMPEWFESLNRDFRYQLTVIGQFAQAIVAEEIKDGRFTIRTDKPSVKVSWQVTGIRQDPYANAHRIPVEEEKPDAERGTYLHPDVYGQLAEMARDYRTTKGCETDQ